MNLTDRMRILEKMRWQETRVTNALEPLRRQLIAVIGMTTPAAATMLGRTELWWQDIATDSGASTRPLALTDVPVIRKSLECITGDPPALPDDFVSVRAFEEYQAELRVLNGLRADLDATEW